MFHSSFREVRRMSIFLLVHSQISDWGVWRKLLVVHPCLLFTQQRVLTWDLKYNRKNFLCDFFIFDTQAALELDLVASPRDVVQVREFWASILQERISQSRSHRIPMNSAVDFSFILIIMTSQAHDQFWDFGWKSIFLVPFVGRHVNPLPLSHRSSLFHKAHGIRRNKFLLRMCGIGSSLQQKIRFLFQQLSLAVIPYWWDWVLARDEVTIPRCGFVLDKWLHMKLSWKKSWKVSEFQFHKCQDTLQYELEALVQ